MCQGLVIRVIQMASPKPTQDDGVVLRPRQRPICLNTEQVVLMVQSPFQAAKPAIDPYRGWELVGSPQGRFGLSPESKPICSRAPSHEGVLLYVPEGQGRLPPGVDARIVTIRERLGQSPVVRRFGHSLSACVHVMPRVSLAKLQDRIPWMIDGHIIKGMKRDVIAPRPRSM